MLKFKETFNLPSGRVFIFETEDGYLIESTEMQDVSTSKKIDDEVRNSLDPRVIWQHLVPKKDKWLFTVSTQKGCVHNCKFCDVAPLPFEGNLSEGEILEQLELMLMVSPHYALAPRNANISHKGKIGFARMGEPAHNLFNVSEVIKGLANKRLFRNIDWLPCFNTIVPKTAGFGKPNNRFSGEDIVKEVLILKEKFCNGMLHFQISCNSTDEAKRKELFGGADVLPLENIIKIINEHEITNRTVALNFIVMEGVPVDIPYLQKLGLNGEKFVVKLIPLNRTNNSEDNGLKTYANYATYEKLQALTAEFKAAGVPVIMDSIARCEEAGLCCGQLVQQYL